MTIYPQSKTSFSVGSVSNSTVYWLPQSMAGIACPLTFAESRPWLGGSSGNLSPGPASWLAKLAHPNTVNRWHRQTLSKFSNLTSPSRHSGLNMTSSCVTLQVISAACFGIVWACCDSAKLMALWQFGIPKTWSKNQSRFCIHHRNNQKHHCICNVW